MSAFMLSDVDIDLILSAAIDVSFAGPLDGSNGMIATTVENATAFGQMLLLQNARSVGFRYRLSGTEEDAENRQAAVTYRYARYDGVRRLAALKLAQCLDYQACETPDYELTAAGRWTRAFCDALRPTELTVPERRLSEKLPWGITKTADLEACLMPPRG